MNPPRRDNLTRCLIPLLLGLFWAATIAHAQSEDPILRIETEMHTARTTDAATDRQGRLLVTVSDDKTARLWSLPDLTPQGVIRPQIGQDQQGRLYAVAMDPDGRWIAVGGWTTPTNDQAVLIIDPRTRQVIRRLGRLPNVVLSLAVSSDGTRLAAGLGTNGIRVWDTTTWQPVPNFAWPDVSGHVYGLSFARDGRLAAGAYGGQLRLFAADGRPLASQSTQAGKRPGRIAFNPDGTRLAVGFEDAVAVELRDGTTLAPRPGPDVGGLRGADLSCVAWSADGTTLYASGGARVGGGFPLFAWGAGGTGPRRVVDEGFSNLFFAVKPLPDGGVAAVSTRGAMTVIDRTGSRGTVRQPVGQDLNIANTTSHITRRLPVTRDGTTVAWVPWAASDRWLRFDAARAALETGDAPDRAFTDANDNAGSLKVTEWTDNPTPKLNGRPLVLRPDEWSRSVAVTPQRAVLGADYTLRLYDPAAKPLWTNSVPGVAWRVNQSPDGRLAIAALNDGTIRWYRLRDGKELLALFVTEDARRWVAFTPKGYYTASPGGDDLIGWHLNRGIDKTAEFFSASRFANRFYRPDVVTRVLATLDEDTALRDADAERGRQTRPEPAISQDLPPVVTILSPADGTRLNGPEAVIEYALRSPSGKPVRAVRVLLNGRPAPTVRGLDAPPASMPTQGPDLRRQVTVPIPLEETVTLTLLAETETKTSEPVRIRLTGAPAPAVAERLLPRLNAVLVGISAYPDPRHKLGFAAKDARDVHDALDKQRGRGLYREVNLRLIPDTQATRGAILRELDWLRRTTTSNDVAIAFLAGHGLQEEGRTFFLPVDGDDDALVATAVAQTDLIGTLNRVPGRVVAFLDICHAAGMVMARNHRSLPDVTGFVNQLREPGAGLIVFAAATTRQPAIELPELGNGAFSKALVEGLLGKADLSRRGAVRTDELNVYIADRVRDLTRGRQAPVMQRPGDIPDFPLVVTGR